MPVDLVIDHSVIVDDFGTPMAFEHNVELEYERNGERYRFLRWGQAAFDNFRVVPPGTGICHQVNLEYLAQTVVDPRNSRGTASRSPIPTRWWARIPTRRWSTAWLCSAGASAASRPRLSCWASRSPCCAGRGRLPLDGQLKEGATATDLVLTVTQMLRKKGVVNKFVEFYGAGLITCRSPTARPSPIWRPNMARPAASSRSTRRPSTISTPGRDDERIALVEAYSHAQGMFRSTHSPDPDFAETLELDLADV